MVSELEAVVWRIESTAIDVLILVVLIPQWYTRGSTIVSGKCREQKMMAIRRYGGIVAPRPVPPVLLLLFQMYQTISLVTMVLWKSQGWSQDSIAGDTEEENNDMQQKQKTILLVCGDMLRSFRLVRLSLCS